MGYTHVLDYEGGKEDWIKGGNPVVGKHAHPHENKAESKDASTNPDEDVA